MAVFPNSARIFNPDAAWTAAQARPDFVSWLASTLQLPGAAEAEALIIANGQITPTRAAVVVDTEGGTSADDLTTISTAGMHDGAVIMLSAAYPGRVVTVRHGTGAGGVALQDGADAQLSPGNWIVLRRSGNRWIEMRWQLAAGRFSRVTIAREAEGAQSLLPNTWTHVLMGAASVVVGDLNAGKGAAGLSLVVPETGMYLVRVWCGFTGAATGGNGTVAFYKNGTVQYEGGYVPIMPGYPCVSAVSLAVPLSAGNTAHVGAWASVACQITPAVGGIEIMRVR